MSNKTKLILKALPKQKKALKKGLINAVLYGPKIKNIHFCLPQKDFTQVFKSAGETQVIEIQFDGGQKQDALIHNFQLHPLTNKVIHVDFYAFKKGEEIVVKVPIEFKGVSPAVKDLGGVFVVSIREIEIKCQADKVPSKIAVDISRLTKIHDEIAIKDITFPPGVKVMQKPETVVASIVPPRVEIEEAQKPTPETETTTASVEEKEITNESLKTQTEGGKITQKTPTAKKVPK